MLEIASKSSRRIIDSRVIIIVLAAGLVHGLVYVFLMPPWQHYDEPNHFEYAWLIAEYDRLPEPADYNQGMRKAVAISMIEHGFFDRLDFLPDLNRVDEPIWIGPISQLKDPPLYYLLAALPLQILHSQPLVVQLYAARLVSLILFLATILAGWGVMAEISPQGHPARLFVPLSIALLPGFTDVMTAINNDAAAVAFASLSLWGCVRLVRQPFSIVNLLLAGTATAACLWTKETVYFTLPVFGIALLLAILRGRYRPIAWAVISLSALAVGLAGISRGEAANWYRATAQQAATRRFEPGAPLGTSAFQIDSGAAVTPNWSYPLSQPVRQLTGAGHSGEIYTVGAWIWAERPTRLNLPVLGDGSSLYYQPVEVGVEPSFHAFTMTLPIAEPHRVWISLAPTWRLSKESVTAYYDGVVLAQGARPIDTPPQFQDLEAKAGEWGEQPFRNLVRNGSAELNGLRISPWIDDLGSRFLPDQTRPSLLLTFVSDWSGAGWYYRLTGERLLRTFWGLFGWAHVPLLGHKPYRILAVVTGLGIIGALVGLGRRIWKRTGTPPWDAWALLALLLVSIWVAAGMRGAIYLASTRLYIPVARYAYPAILPSMFVLSLGWWEMLGWLPAREPGRNSMSVLRSGVIIAGLLALDVYAIISILSYYTGLP
jgi:hypothetical protein